MLSDLDAVNRDLKSLKGIGTLRIEDPERRQGARAAWIVAAPDRLRLELLSVSGSPAVSFSADGSSISLFLHDRGQWRRGIDADLERFVGVPLTVAEVICLLSGRAPPVQAAGAALQEGVLILENDRGQGVQRLTLIADAAGRVTGVRSVEVFDDTGRLRYRADFERIREEGAFRIPDRIRISRSDRAQVRLSVDRMWINPSLSPEAFVLDMQNGGKGTGRSDGG
jgi:hypothetical protein